MICGIDIGGTNTVVGFVDKKGKILQEFGLKTVDYTNIESYVNDISIIIEEFAGSTLEGIGIGCPNGNYSTGCMHTPPNLPFKGVIPLRSIFENLFNVPVVLTNDANAAAIGEMVYGGAKNLKDFVTITIGTGLGSGIVANGKLVCGFNGFAGELGHTIIVPNGRPCGCGRKGCLERYVSASGIIATYKELGGKDVESFKVINNLAQERDITALQTMEQTAYHLGLALANMVAITAPGHIFLFGGVVNCGSVLIEPTRKYMESFLLFSYQNKIKICVSELQNKNAAVLGTAALVQNEISSSVLY